MGNKILLEAKNITKQFPGVIALKDVDFSLEYGEIHALLGENGAGKSTLIKVITGVEHLDKGKVFLEEKQISPKTPQQAQDLGISTVYQEVNLCSNLSVAENIFIGRENFRKGKGIAKVVDWKYANKNAQEILKQLNVDIDVTQPLDQYSVAIQQMVAIARAISVNAKVLILDEPTSSLNQFEVDNLFKTMKMLKEKNMGIVFVTHFLDQVYQVTDRITVLRNGSYVGTYKTSELQKVELVGKMIGKEYDGLYIDKTDTSQDEGSKEVILQLNDITTYQLRNPLSFDVNKGEVLGFAGLLGSGRTELSRMIFGVDRVLSGKVKLKGKEVHFKKPINAIRNGIGYSSEDRKSEGIISDLSIRENIIVALQAKKGMFKFIRRKEQDKIADEYIKLLSIKTPSSEQLIKNLSGGNQQKVLLARWLATNPDLLILDEPTRGIDIGTKAEIQKLVVKLSKDGMSVIFISSEIDEMIRNCNRIIILDNKNKVGEISGIEINENIIMNKMAGGGDVESN